MGLLFVARTVFAKATSRLPARGMRRRAPGICPRAGTRGLVAGESGARREIWGYVVNPRGVCIEGATVEVVDIVLPPGTVSEVPRSLLGQKVTQPYNTPRFGGGFEFDGGAPPDVEVTLRASAPGFVSKEQTIIPYTETIDRTITLVPTGS